VRSEKKRLSYHDYSPTQMLNTVNSCKTSTASTTNNNTNVLAKTSNKTTTQCHNSPSHFDNTTPTCTFQVVHVKRKLIQTYFIADSQTLTPLAPSKIPTLGKTHHHVLASTLAPVKSHSKPFKMRTQHICPQTLRTPIAHQNPPQSALNTPLYLSKLTLLFPSIHFNPSNSQILRAAFFLPQLSSIMNHHPPIPPLQPFYSDLPLNQTTPVPLDSPHFADHFHIYMSYPCPPVSLTAAPANVYFLSAQFFPISTTKNLYF
jgi:hypothetical protein